MLPKGETMIERMEIKGAEQNLMTLRKKTFKNERVERNERCQHFQKVRKMNRKLNEGETKMIL